MADFGIGETVSAAVLAEGASTAAEAAAVGAASQAALTASTAAAASSAAAASTTLGLTAGQWLAISGAASGIGTAGSTMGQLRNAGNQSTMAKLGQRAALVEAASKQDAAAYSAQQFARRASLLEGKQVATTAASGVSTQSGSPIFAELDAAKQAELEKQ